MQQQSNGSDCGVFAIAFATVLVYNLDKNIPEFNVHQMRTHLSTCLKNGLITPFSVIEQFDVTLFCFIDSAIIPTILYNMKQFLHEISLKPMQRSSFAHLIITHWQLILLYVGILC